ncbi:MAG: FkbM family methyltransferase [Chloroflexota bacterium]
MDTIRLGRRRRNPRTALGDITDHLDQVLPLQRGCYVELSANDGIEQSNTYWLERERGRTGLLVEPIVQRYFPDFRSCFRVWGHGEGKRAGQGLGLGPITFGALARPLQELLDEAKAPERIEFLSLDVEGSERAVLEGVLNERRRGPFDGRDPVTRPRLRSGDEHPTRAAKAVCSVHFLAGQSPSGQDQIRFRHRTSTGRDPAGVSRNVTHRRSFGTARVPHVEQPTTALVVSTSTTSSAVPSATRSTSNPAAPNHSAVPSPTRSPVSSFSDRQAVTRFMETPSLMAGPSRPVDPRFNAQGRFGRHHHSPLKSEAPVQRAGPLWCPRDGARLAVGSTRHSSDSK